MSPLKRFDISLLRSKHGTRWKCWDFAVGITAFCLGFLLTPHRHAIPEAVNVYAAGILFGAILMLCSRLCGVPNPGRGPSRYEIITASILAIVLTYLIFALLIWFAFFEFYGRYVIGYTILLSLIGLALPRMVALGVLKAQPLNVVIYGAGEKGEAALKRLAKDPHFKVLGFLDNNPIYHGAERFGHPVFGSIHTFGREQLAYIDVSIVVIAVSARRLMEDNARELLELPLAGIEILNLGGFVEHYFKEIDIGFDCPDWFASTPSVPGNPSIFAAKRIIDIAGGVLGLLISLPLWPLIAIAIKLDSSGPVLFKQTRVGWHNRPFTIVKFRTMASDAEKNGAQWAEPEDDRVTRVGKFLRRTRLDELPQFWNVLKGDMALVGPRPERPQFVEGLAKEIPFYEQRHLVPPGLTGWAQVRYRYGASKEDAKRKLQFELYYIRHLSLMFDIEILLRTIPMLAKGSR